MRRNLRVVLLMLAACATATPALAEMTIKTTTLGHGVEAWYAPNEAVPIVDVQIVFDNAGATQDPEGKSGRAAFTAAMLTEGAGPLDSQAFARALDAAAISLSFQADDDRFVAHIYCLREHAQEAGRLLALALGQPLLHEADIARVKTQIYSVQSQLAESPDYEAGHLLDVHAFGSHPYANPVYGTAQSVARLSAQDARDVLAHMLTRKNITISAAGDVSASLLESMLSPMIDGLSDAPAPAPVAMVAMKESGKVLRQRQEVPQTVITFIAPGIARDDPRFYAAYLLNEIMGGGTLTSRLSNEVRQQKGLVYSVGTDLDLKNGISLLSGELATRNSTADKALDAVKGVFADIRAKGVTADECVDAKSYVIGHFPLQLDRTGNVSGILYTMQRYHLGKDYLTERVALFNAVSCNDINAVARDLLAPEKFLFAVVGGTSDAGAPPITPAPAHGDAR